MDNRKVLSFPDFACRKSTMLLRHVQKAKIYEGNGTESLYTTSYVDLYMASGFIRRIQYS